MEVVEEDGLEPFFVRGNLIPRGGAVGTEVGDDGGDGGDKLVRRGGEA